MKKTKIFIVIGLLFSSFLIALPISSVKANSSINTLYCHNTQSPPTIDGIFDNSSEWSDAYHTSFYHSNPSEGHQPNRVHIYIKNTNDTLYILIDSLPDTDVNGSDGVNIDFDCNHDGIRDYNISMSLRRDKEPSLSYGLSIAKWNIGFNDSVNENIDHSIIEIAINITMDAEYDGSSKPEDIDYKIPVKHSSNSIKIMLDAAVSFCNWTIPQDVDVSDSTTYASLIFGMEPDDPNIPFSSFGIIIMITSITIIGMSIVIIKRKEI